MTKFARCLRQQQKDDALVVLLTPKAKYSRYAQIQLASKPTRRKLPTAPAASEAMNNCSACYNFLKALLKPEVAINNESCALISDHNIWLSKRRALSGIITEARSLYCEIDESFVELRLYYPPPLLHLRYVFYHLLN